MDDINDSPEVLYLVCLTASGGVPLFTRTKGTDKPLAFAEIGMLNGVSMFAQNHGIKLKSTNTEDAKIFWKTFHDSINMVVVTGDDLANDLHLNRLLDQVFKAMTLLVGIDDLVNIKNVERLKKDLRSCYKLVDALLEDTYFFGPLTDSVDVISCPLPESPALQGALEEFVGGAGSTYGFLCAQGRVCTATAKWWEMAGQEMMLLALLIYSLPQSMFRDIPVYLPCSSPQVPHRLLTFQLLSGIEVCVICGPTPSLGEVEAGCLGQCWQPAVDSLRAACNLCPRNFPNTTQIDDDILGFVLVNTEQHKCLSTLHVNPPATSDDAQQPVNFLSRKQRRKVIRAYFKSTIGTVFPPVHSPPIEEKELYDLLYTQLPHKAKETYMCSDQFKCYAIQNNKFQFFALFSPSTPTFAMRTVARNTLATLSKDKIFEEKKKAT